MRTGAAGGRGDPALAMNKDIQEDIAAALRSLLGRDPRSVTQLKGGVNNVCIKVDDGADALLAKKYFRHKGDRRDRLNTEFSMLSFLWKNGLRCIPEPIMKDDRLSIGLYHFVEGTRPGADEIDRADVMQMRDLLGAMWDLKCRPGAESLAPGSDAAFRMQDYVDCIQRRFDLVRHCADSDNVMLAFREFVEKRMASAYRLLLDRFREKRTQAGLDPAAELQAAERTLNPADHGFHNAIRRPDGSLVFIDFEYAGWDDPAQMICNACLQSEAPIPRQLIGFFLRAMLKRLAAGPELIKRIEIVYPLLAFKWCLIMLNEFLPVSDERRKFAGADPKSRRAAQLQKARKQLEKVEAFLAGDDLANELKL